MLRPWDKKVDEGEIRTTIINRDGTIPEYINRSRRIYKLDHHNVDPLVLLGFVFTGATYRQVESQDRLQINWQPYARNW